MSHSDTILGSIRRGFGTLKTIRKGRKADRLRKRLIRTRKVKNLSEQAGASHASAVRKAKRFNTKK